MCLQYTYVHLHIHSVGTRYGQISAHHGAVVCVCAYMYTCTHVRTCVYMNVVSYASTVEAELCVREWSSGSGVV